MNGDITELEAAVRLAIAALIGLGVGLEREWSTHASGREPRFAGLRTFLMLGMIGGSAGLLASLGHSLGAAALLGGAGALSVAAYIVTARRDDTTVDGTTETAALLVIGLGTLAGIGWIALAAAAASLIVLALSEKERLHGVVRHVRADELRAALRFSVLALVVLPLLPSKARIGTVTVEPRTLWIIVLFFCALNFAGFVIRRSVGPGRGYGIVGMIGGLISSTAVTLDFSRRSRREPGLAASLAHGVIGACTVLIPRVLVVSAVLDARVARALLPLLAPALAIGVWIVWRDWGSAAADTAVEDGSPNRNPLRLGVALQMAVAFQLAMSVIEYVRARWATPGVFATAVGLGLTDVDALTVGMSRAAGEISADVAARAIAVGILANTMFKLALSLSLGDSRFRRTAGRGLAGMAAASAIGAWLL